MRGALSRAIQSHGWVSFTDHDAGNISTGISAVPTDMTIPSLPSSRHQQSRLPQEYAKMVEQLGQENITGDQAAAHILEYSESLNAIWGGLKHIISPP